MKKTIHVHLELSWNLEIARWALMGLLLLLWSPPLGSESLTLSTYYPSPLGVYRQLVTTGSGSTNTLLARDGGSVGIGTSSPGQKLDVTGNIRAQGTGASLYLQSQRLSGDNGSKLQVYSNDVNTSQLSLHLAGSAFVGAMAGTSGGATGMVDQSGRWTLVAQNGSYTDVRVSGSSMLTVYSNRAELQGYLHASNGSCSVRYDPNGPCGGGYATWEPGFKSEGLSYQSRPALPGGYFLYEPPGATGASWYRLDQIFADSGGYAQATWYCCPN